MIPTLAAFLQTITGKVVLGITVATASVGAAAAGAPVPVVQELVPGSEGAADAGDNAELAAAEDSDDGEGFADEGPVDGDENPVDGETPDVDEDDDDGLGLLVGAAHDLDEDDAVDADKPNHGEIVSGFATSTELEGCERGQAVSAVARGILDPDDPDFDTQLTEYLDDLGKCDNTDDVGEDVLHADLDADEPNHGEIVSGFATSTELEGCEHGQAVSAVARGILDPNDPDFDTQLTEYLDDLGKCDKAHDEGEATVDGVAEDDASPRGQEKDKPDKAGKSGEKGNRPAHAGNGKP